MIYKIAGILTFLGIWWLTSVSGVVNSFLLPSPFVVLTEVIRLFLDTRVYQDIGMTLFRLAAGFGGGFVVGTVLGVLMGEWRTIDGFFSFLVDFFRSLPVTALIPLFILLFGIGELSRVGIVIVVTALVMTVNARAGVRSIPEALRDVATVYRIRGWRFIREILVLGAMPLIANGIRLSLSISLIVVIVVEMFGTTGVGLGRRIIDAQFYFKTAELYALILISGVIGFVVNWLFGIAERRWVHWAGK